MSYPEGELLFVLVRGYRRIWRLLGYDDRVLRLESYGGKTRLDAPYEICRIGEARNWRDSTSFREAWLTGGGERFK